ncbi:prepilin peptidase [Planococcus lenghuensis]|uniref:Prepilin peptidase n=1 Tax=Planococcus lenghuensis TaxID=2213202 RepID=A0A1Q2KXE6_9BACL|nr:A24 family peptidase [Planococcus lenghuensis]AQQ52895.1 prepilin peptidase [Planococcus lenghuensis]
MEIVIALFVFAFGLVFGSFYNVAGLRIPVGESIAYPPSHCTTCDRRLTAGDLVPVLSFLVLRGKCRSCGERIRWVYPFMEFVTALLFAGAYLQFGLTPEFFVAVLFLSLLVIITVSDIAYMLIPDKVLLPIGAVLLVARLFVPLNPWWDSIVGGLVGFSLLMLIALVSKGGMGGGDIKLFFVIGLVLGTAGTLLTLFLASLIGAVAGIIQLRVTKQGRKTPIPFGPWIALASVIVYFWGSQLMSLYMGLW